MHKYDVRAARPPKPRLLEEGGLSYSSGRVAPSVLPLIDYVRHEDAPEEVREALDSSAYADSEDRHLFYELLSNSPSVVTARSAYFRELMGGGEVPQREKELAYLAVALVTDTRFVAATHGRYLVDDHDVPPETITAIAGGDPSDLDARDRAVVSFAATVARNPEDVSETDLQALFDAGYDDGTAVELLVLTCDAQTATSIVTATEMELSDADRTEPAFLPDTFDL